MTTGDGTTASRPHVSDDRALGSLSWRVIALEDEVRRLRAQLGRDNRSDPTEPTVGPIFIGGTGRSGTWVMGRLLERHREYEAIHTELRFHATDEGFRPLLDGRESIDDFADRVESRWFEATGPGGRPKGLRLLVKRKELPAARKLLRAHADEGDLAAGVAAYMHYLVDPFAVGRGASTWIETTPDNAAVSDCLHRVFPNARVIHMVRDGRDVASSVVTMAWGPATMEEAIDWWADRIGRAHTAITAGDPDRAMTVRLEELLITERDTTLERVLDLLNIDDRRRLRNYQATRMDATRGNVGRWRHQHQPADRERIDAHYRTRYRDLEQDGVTCLPIHPDIADALAVRVS